MIDGLEFRFRLEGYPLAVPLAGLPGTIEVRPEATIFTATHAAFTIRQIIFAPIDEPAVVVLLDIDTTLPMTVIGRFRPALRPMWPAGAPTANTGWNASEHVYQLSEESGRFAAIVGVPGGADQSVMPYQEEPRDVPFVPIVMSAAIDGRAPARATYARVLGNIEALYRGTAGHYRRLLEESACSSRK